MYAGMLRDIRVLFARMLVHSRTTELGFMALCLRSWTPSNPKPRTPSAPNPVKTILFCYRWQKFTQMQVGTTVRYFGSEGNDRSTSICRRLDKLVQKFICKRVLQEDFCTSRTERWANAVKNQNRDLLTPSNAIGCLAICTNLCETCAKLQ